MGGGYDGCDGVVVVQMERWKYGNDGVVMMVWYGIDIGDCVRLVGLR